MERSSEPEILDSNNVAAELANRAYREVAWIHHLLGDTRAVIKAIRRDPLPVRRVLDIGCARGDVLRQVQRALGVEVIGVDVAPPPASSIRILQIDAVRDSLPEADVAFSMHVAHHLSEADFVAMIRNVGRSCRRFIVVDLVRDRVPLSLFRLFVVPFVSPITAADGQLSVRKAYSGAEMNNLVARALQGSNATYRHSVAFLSIRQVVDISW